MREAVRYAKNNMKWTAADMKMYVDSHANGLLENRFQSGDSIAVWLPESAEKVRYDVTVTLKSIAPYELQITKHQTFQKLNNGMIDIFLQNSMSPFWLLQR